VHPSVPVTGQADRKALIACFVLTQRNSLVTVLLGMPIDRTLFYHAVRFFDNVAYQTTTGRTWNDNRMFSPIQMKF